MRWPVLVLALAACDGSRTLEAPADIAFVAVVEPQVRSPLVPIDAAATFVAGDLAQATVIGFGADQLDPALAPLDVTEPLDLDTRGCGLLPTARWARRWEGDEAVEVPAPELALGASWMRAGCPPPGLLHVTCRSFRVCTGPPQVLDEPCTWSVGCSDDSTLRVHAGVWPSAFGCASIGETRARMTSERWSADRRDYHARVELGGDTCVIEGRTNPPPALEIPASDVVRVWSGTARTPGTLDNDNGSPFVDARAVRGGGITGFLIDQPGRRAIVAVTDDFVCPTERNGARGAWRTVDLDAVALSTRTIGRAPPCLMGVRRISAEQEPLRIVGFTVDNTRSLLIGYEFDASLRQVRRTVLTHVLPSVLVADVLITPSRWLVLTTQSDSSPAASIHAIDPRLWTVTATLAMPLGAAHSLELGEDGAVRAFLRDRVDACHIDDALATAACASVCGREVFSPASSVLKLTSVARDPGDGAPVLAASDAFHGLFACGRDLWLQPADGSAQMVAVEPLSAGRILTSAVGRWDGPAWRGRLLVADLELGGFERQAWDLPGTVAASLVRDGDRVWIVMPYDGLLVRLGLEALAVR